MKKKQSKKAGKLQRLGFKFENKLTALEVWTEATLADHLKRLDIIEERLDYIEANAVAKQGAQDLTVWKARLAGEKALEEFTKPGVEL